MVYEIFIEGQLSILTTEHAASNHGLPVLVGADGIARGSADTCRLLVDGAGDEAIAELRRAGFEFDDARPE